MLSELCVSQYIIYHYIKTLNNLTKKKCYLNYVFHNISYTTTLRH